MLISFEEIILQFKKQNRESSDPQVNIIKVQDINNLLRADMCRGLRWLLGHGFPGLGEERGGSPVSTEHGGTSNGAAQLLCVSGFSEKVN